MMMLKDLFMGIMSNKMGSKKLVFYKHMFYCKKLCKLILNNVPYKFRFVSSLCNLFILVLWLICNYVFVGWFLMQTQNKED